MVPLAGGSANEREARAFPDEGSIDASPFAQALLAVVAEPRPNVVASPEPSAEFATPDGNDSSAAITGDGPAPPPPWAAAVVVTGD